MYSRLSRLLLHLQFGYFWRSQTSWLSQTWFPSQWLQKSTLVITYICAIHAQDQYWSLSFLHMVTFIEIQSLLFFFIDFGHYFYYEMMIFLVLLGISMDKWVWTVTSTIIPYLRIHFCSQFVPVRIRQRVMTIFVIFRILYQQKWAVK